MHRLLSLPLILLLGLGACGDANPNKVGDTCTHQEECSDGICGQGLCLPPHTVVLPSAPSFISYEPPSPSNDPEPTLHGKAFPGEEVTVYADADCTTALAQSLAGDDGYFDIPIQVEKNAQTTFYIQSKERNLYSACVQVPQRYDHHDQPPAPPTFSEALPPSPSQESRPTLGGETLPGATVTLYLDTKCEHPVGDALADQGGLFWLPVQLPENTESTIYARTTDRYGNLSACTDLAVYIHDTLPPGAAWMTPEQRDAVPQPSDQPEDLQFCVPLDDDDSLDGSGLELRAFAGHQCRGTRLNPTATGALCDGGFVYAVETATDLSVQLVDRAGNIGPCADLFTFDDDMNGSIEHAPPAAPGLVRFSPTSPSTETNPTLIGLADPLLRVELFDDASCTNLLQSTRADDTGHFFALIAATPNAETAIYAQAIGVDDQRSACVLLGTYVHNDQAPAPPWMTSQQRNAVPQPSDQPEDLQFCTEAGATAEVFEGTGCAGPAIPATPITDPECESGQGWRVTIQTTISARSHSQTQVQGSCTHLFTFDDDMTGPIEPDPPTPPQLTGFSPPSPSTETQPTLIGQAQPHTQVTLAWNATCNNTIRTTRADDTGGFLALVEVPANAETPIYGQAIGDDGQRSACVLLGRYRHDNRVPDAPWMTAQQEGAVPQPSDQPENLQFCSEAGNTVEVFEGESCAGAPISATPITDPQCGSGQGWRVTIQTTISARSRSQTQVQSPCAHLFTFDDDVAGPLDPPNPPGLDGFSPPSPSTETQVTLIGRAQPHTQVTLAWDATCSNTIRTTRADDDGDFLVLIEVPANTESRIYGQAIGDDGQRSACVLLGNYQHDNRIPVAPWMTPQQRNAVPQPSNKAETIRFCTETGMTPEIFTSAQCTGGTMIPAATSDPECAGAQGWQIKTKDRIYARATSITWLKSECVMLFDFDYDNIPPPRPRIEWVQATHEQYAGEEILQADFEVQGRSEAHSLLEFHIDGSVVHTHQLGASSDFKILVPNIDTSGTGTVTTEIRAIDRAGNISDPVSYVLAGRLNVHLHHNQTPLIVSPVVLQDAQLQPYRTYSLNAQGRIQGRVLAGHALTYSAFPSNPNFPTRDLIGTKLFTIQDLQPPESFSFDLSSLTDDPCALGQCSVGQPIGMMSEYKFHLSDFPTDAQVIQLRTSCGGEANYLRPPGQLGGITIPMMLSRTCLENTPNPYAFAAAYNLYSLFGLSDRYLIDYSHRGIRPNTTDITMPAWHSESGEATMGSWPISNSSPHTRAPNFALVGIADPDPSVRVTATRYFGDLEGDTEDFSPFMHVPAISDWGLYLLTSPYDRQTETDRWHFQFWHQSTPPSAYTTYDVGLDFPVPDIKERYFLASLGLPSPIERGRGWEYIDFHDDQGRTDATYTKWDFSYQLCETACIGGLEAGSLCFDNNDCPAGECGARTNCERIDHSLIRRPTATDFSIQLPRDFPGAFSSRNLRYSLYHQPSYGSLFLLFTEGDLSWEAFKALIFQPVFTKDGDPMKYLEALSPLPQGHGSVLHLWP